MERQNQPYTMETSKHYSKFPPIEIPAQGRGQCIKRFADKFFCVGYYLIFETSGKISATQKKTTNAAMTCVEADRS